MSSSDVSIPSKDEKRSKLFFTTTDLLNKINSVMQEEQLKNSSTNDGDPLQEPQTDQPQFELQRRLPDGSTRKASKDEADYADFQAKLKQAGQVVSALSPKEKLQWAESHRQEGNTLYSQQQYKGAMDVYLTCLVAIDKSPQNPSDEVGNIAYSNTDWEQKVEQQVKLPVLLNLSACTLKLGMLKKTCSFCDLALDLDIGKTSPKLYFRRGSAKTSLGLYEEGKQDLAMSMEILRKQESDEASNDLADKNEICKMRQAVEKEMLRLESLVVSAERNHQRQTRAMQRILGGEKEAAVTQVTGETSINGSSAEILRNDVTKSGRRSANASTSEERLYNTATAQRKYSTLRAPLQTNVQEIAGERHRNGTFVWYIKTVERSLRKILFWLGDENAMTKSFDDVEDLKNKSE